MENNQEFLPLVQPRISLRRFLFYFITLAALFLIYSQISEFRLLKEVFLRSNLWWLIGIIITQFLSYWALAYNYRDVLRVKDLSVSASVLFPITLVIQFLNQALPSATISGQVFFIQYLKRYGLSLAEGIGRAIVELITLYFAFGIFFFLSALLLFQNGALVRPEISYLTYFFILVGLTVGLIFLVLQRRGRGRIARWTVGKLHRYFEGTRVANHTAHVATIFDQLRQNANIGELSKHKWAFWAACFWQGMSLLLNVFTLYFISLAIGAPLSFTIAFIVFTLTKFIAMISFIPGAFGVFEGGMTLILVSFNLSAQAALAITLLFRAFTFWFPMPIGWVLFRRYLKQNAIATT